MKQPKCQLCKANEATWAMQYIGEDQPSFYALGWHIRGFKVTKVCDKCRKEQYEEHRRERTATEAGD